MRFLRRGPGEEDQGGGPGAPENGPDTGAPEGDEEKKGLISDTRESLAPVPKKHLFVASLGLMGFAAAGLLLFSAASFWWTSQPSFCNRCHVMNKYVAAWEQSPHNGINCESCHTNPGFFGFMGGKIAGLQVVANYVRGEFTDDSFNAFVSNAACLQCHEELLEKEFTDPETQITVDHGHIIGAGGKCMSCHSTVAHGDTVPIGSATFPTMDTCMKCHNGVAAPTDCKTCHREGPPAPSPPTNVWGGNAPNEDGGSKANG